MMRGTSNEAAVVSALRALSFVREVFESGLLAYKDDPYLACSSDCIVLFNKSSLSLLSDAKVPLQNAAIAEEHLESTDHDSLVLASLEIKTRVAPSTLGQIVSLSQAEAILYKVGDETFRQYIPREHTAQIVHQLLVLGFPYSVYVAAAETGLLYTVVIKCPDVLIETCFQSLQSVAKPVPEWANQPNTVMPSFLTAEYKETINANLNFWRMVDAYVNFNGKFRPLKRFKHAAQSFYSKIKAGFDGSTQKRAIFRSSTSHLKWEQNIMSQNLKTIAINAFLAWCMFERQALLESPDNFRALDKYRNMLNNVQATADFVYDVSKELILHAETITIQAGEQQDGECEAVDKTEGKRLKAIAKARRRKILILFNSTDGAILRLAVLEHTLMQAQVLYCVICRQKKGPLRGHRTSFSCQFCSVHLCIRTYPGLRESCWSLWHSSRVLKLRSTTRLASAISRDDADESDQDERAPESQHAVSAGDGGAG